MFAVKTVQIIQPFCNNTYYFSYDEYLATYARPIEDLQAGRSLGRVLAFSPTLWLNPNVKFTWVDSSSPFAASA